jgi:putative endonuclease
MHYVYILKGPKQLYIGYTNNLKRRFEEHQKGFSKATRNRGPWEIIYYEACKSNIDALKREKYLKTAWGRRYINSRLKNSA